MTDMLGRITDGLPAVLVAATALVLAAAGVWQIWRAMGRAASEGFAVYWQVGGFGTPGRGWRVSLPLMQLLTGLALVAASTALVPTVSPGLTGKGNAAVSAAPAASSASSPAPSSSASAPAAAGASAPASAASR